MAKIIKENNRKVFFIEAGDDLDAAMNEFLLADASEISGEVNSTRYRIDKSVVNSMKENHGVNAVREVVIALEKEQKDESKSTEE